MVTGPVRACRLTQDRRSLDGQWMEDVDRPADIEALPQPTRARRSRVNAQTLRRVPRAEGLRRISGHCRRRRHLGQISAIRPSEAKHAIRLSINLKALLVNGAVVPATQHGEIRERRGPTVRPVAEVMPLAEWQPAAGKAAAAIPMMKRPPQRRGNRPGPSANLDHATILVVSHHHSARVAGQAPRRFRGNVRAVLEDGLARLIRVRQHRRIDVDHHLVALSRRPGIEPVMEGGFREQGQRIRLLLGHAPPFGGTTLHAVFGAACAAPGSEICATRGFFSGWLPLASWPLREGLLSPYLLGTTAQSHCSWTELSSTNGERPRRRPQPTLACCASPLFSDGD